MKRMKKLASIVLALVMVFAMAMPAMAADDLTITIKNATKGHTYKAYQIFIGSVDGTTMGNIEWGANMSSTENQAILMDKYGANTLEELLKAIETAEDAATFANYVRPLLNGTAVGTSVQDGDVYEISGLSSGYYLVVDVVDPDSPLGELDAYSSYIVEVVGDAEVDPKIGVPEVDKQVQDEVADAEAGHDDEGWGETADHDLNESFKFKLTATMPAEKDFDAYETYKMVFHDTMSAGVTFESIDSVTIEQGVAPDIVGEPITINAKSAENPNGYVVEGVEEGQSGVTWTLTIENLKAYGIDITKGVTVTVIYNAHLNENAEVNAPQADAQDTDNKNTVYLEYSNNPNIGGEGDLGKTPEDTVFVFTYEMPNTKTGDKDGDGVNEPLAGAGFTLKREGSSEALEFVWDAELKAYRPANENDRPEDIVTEIFSQEDGNFSIKGLDVGTYILEETTTPAGYNTLEKVTIVVEATHLENGTDKGQTTVTMTMNGEPSTANEIINDRGTTLPETGGIGTTIFYVVGAILVIGAVVLLVTKKRMSQEQ